MPLVRNAVHEGLAAAIAGLRPGAQWVLSGDTLADLEWLDTAQLAPTQAEIDAYAPPAPVPASISDRQFFQQLAVQGIITQADALAAVKTGTIPAALQQLIGGLPTDQQFGATMIVSGATTFERNHPLTIAIGTAYGWTSDEVDALFRTAGAL